MKHPKRFDTDSKTSERMANVKLKKGTAEQMLAKELWKRGFRYWLNRKSLPGSPDIALKKYNIAIFIDGEFWHGFDWENKKTRLNRNREYWIEKIEENITRDNRVDRELRALGWIPIRFWSKEVLNDTERCVCDIEDLVLKIKTCDLIEVNNDYAPGSV